MKKSLSLLLCCMLLFLACDLTDKISITDYSLSGYAQKGPFVNGSSVELYELNDSLVQTGKSFNTQIETNDGKFSTGTISLESSLVEMKVDGYYYNEVSGETSDAQLTLYALADVSKSSTINTNLLTTVEKARVKYIISQGSEYSLAKEIAQTEIFSAFDIELDEYAESEKLSIDGTSSADRAMLAVTLILTGYRTNAELTELLSNLSTDLAEDGTIDSTSLQSKLINHAKYLNITTIEENIKNYYSDMGKVIEVPDFEIYLNNFINNTNFEFTGSPITYEEDGTYGKNILSDNVESISVNTDCTIEAIIPDGGSLKVKITALGESNDEILSSNIWFLQMGNSSNISADNWNSGVQTFTFTDTGQGKIWIEFATGSYQIDFYEMSDTITKTKTIVAS